MKKKFYRKKTLILPFLFVLFSIAPSWGQTLVSGTIVDEEGVPVTGATVLVKGTTIGASSDENGYYSISVPGDVGNPVLVYTLLGYVDLEETVGGRTAVNVTLVERISALDEVVVVGYGTLRKSDVTGSISLTKSEDMLKQQSFGALDGLKGKASGVNIFSNSGQPGGAVRVMIRGIGTINSSSNPLYIVDGVAMEDFKYLNPNDIDHIEVLKDASSAAIYGARGANGVIMVTTKRGTKGKGASVSYAGSMSVGQMASYMELMNAEEWQRAVMLSLENANRWYGKSYSTRLSDHFKDPALFNADGTAKYDTDWQREATRTTFSHNHQLSIRQGTENSSVGAFLNYTDQQGLMLDSWMKRANAKITYDVNPMKWFSSSINLLVNHTWGSEAEEDGGHQMPRRSIIEMVPFMPVKFPDGRWSNSTTITDDLGLEGMANPVHVLTTQQRMRYRTQIFGNAAFTFHLLPGLDLKTQLGIDSHRKKFRDYSPKDLANISYPNGRARIEEQDVFYWQEETYLTWNRTANKHRINLMAGLSWQERVYRNNYVQTQGFADDFFGTDNMGAGTIPETPSSGYERWAMNSYFLRGAYSYDNKYLATVTARMDGSSKFGINNKYAFFPSVGLGWILSNESFMKDAAAVNQLKLHSSYGVTGNSEIGTYRSLATVTSGSVLINGERAPSSNTERLANPNLKWEKTAQFDAGLNLVMFDNRLNLDVSYYYKLTSDLLLDRPVPRSTGYSSVIDNIGSVANRGIDFLLNTVNVRSRDFEWSSSLNLNYNRNKIVALGENDEDILPGPNWVSGSQTILRVGESLSSFWGYERIGIWTEAEAEQAKAAGAKVGEAKRSAEKKILGKGIPDLTGSFVNTIRYRNFDFTLDLQFVAGVNVLQQFYHSTEDRFGIANALVSTLNDAWSPTNTDTRVQALRHIKDSQNTEVDSRWVCDGSYIRGNLIQLGYSFDEKVLRALRISALRAYLNVSNAFVIRSKDFQGYDPEGTSQGDNQWGQNMFFFQYPKARTFSLGLNLTF
ncbi:MAG: TonB-dependent receptor [Prevotellaceae bacterium]|jgi:TonB-linked SusC/RagA family outer membrane protein|nr:TonB-dependent receptor [Prevotellaceae bacterium]